MWFRYVEAVEFEARFRPSARSSTEEMTLAVTRAVTSASCHAHYFFEDVDIGNETQGQIRQGLRMLRPVTLRCLEQE